MSINRSEAIILFAILGSSVAFAIVLGLMVIALNSLPPTSQAWIWVWGVVTLYMVVTSAIRLGRFIARWRAKRAKVPDGPEADYVDPAA
jgi:hypothetical protein